MSDHLSYADIFERRGTSYARAMRDHPRARDAEFRQLLEPLELGEPLRLGDAPAGGGYLEAYLPPHCSYLPHEPCATFAGHSTALTAPQSVVPLLPMPWEDGHLDALVSLAGVHHLDDKAAFAREAARTVRPGGQFVLSDVAASTPVARFLDDFVGAHNSTGHDGLYLDAATVPMLEEAGWRLVSDRHNAIHWTFADRTAMATFAADLFDVQGVPTAEMADAIERMLGVDTMADGGVGMRWSLRTLHLMRVETAE